MTHLKQFFLFPKPGQYISFKLTGDASHTGLTFGRDSGSFSLIHIKLVLHHNTTK